MRNQELEAALEASRLETAKWRGLSAGIPGNSGVSDSTEEALLRALDDCERLQVEVRSQRAKVKAQNEARAASKEAEEMQVSIFR